MLNAFTPKSNDSNQNLEFLETIGDTVLKFITCWFLFTRLEGLSESLLTFYKSVLISNTYYIYQAHLMKIGYYIRDLEDRRYNFFHEDNKYLSYNESSTICQKQMCDAFEALFAALFYESFSLDPLLRLLIENTNVFMIDQIKDSSSVEDFKQLTKNFTQETFLKKFMGKEWQLKFYSNVFQQSHQFSEMEIEFLEENISIRELLKKGGLYELYQNAKSNRDFSYKSFVSLLGLDFITQEKYNEAFRVKTLENQRMEFLGDSYFEFFFLTSVGKNLLNSTNKNHNPTFLQKTKVYFLSNVSQFFFCNLFFLPRFRICDDESLCHQYDKYQT